MAEEPYIRWNELAGCYFVDYGNVRMALTRDSALILARALLNVVIRPAAKPAKEASDGK